MGERGLRKAAAVLGKAVMASASCGAGVSAESGIPTFRDTGGIGGRIDPVEVGTPGGLMRTLEREAHRLLPLFAEILDSFPNADDLHQEAGSSDAIEVHGNMFRMKCLACRG